MKTCSPCQCSIARSPPAFRWRAKLRSMPRLCAYLEALVQRAWFLVYGPRTSFCRLAPPLSRRRLERWRCAPSAFDLADRAGGDGGRNRGRLAAGRAAIPDWYFSLVPSQFSRCCACPVPAMMSLQGNAVRHQPGEHENDAQVGLCRLSVQQQRAGFHSGLRAGLCLRHSHRCMLLVQNTGTLGRDVVALSRQGADARFRRLAIGPRHDRTVRRSCWRAHRGCTLAARLPSPAREARCNRGRCYRRTAAPRTVMTGVVLMLVVAAMLEGFARQLINNTQGRLIGWPVRCWRFWLGLFLRLVRRDRQGDLGG